MARLFPISAPAYAPGRLAIMPCLGIGATLAEDIARLQAFGARLLLGLVEEPEYADLGALRAALAASGIAYLRHPIADFGVPTDAAEWRLTANSLHDALDGGAGVAIHCLGGRGRSGMAAARLLAERGEAPDSAIAAVRSARSGAIETAAQERFVRTGLATTD